MKTLKQISIFFFIFFLALSCKRINDTSFKEILLIHYDFRTSDYQSKDDFYITSFIKIDSEFNVSQLAMDKNLSIPEQYSIRKFAIEEKAIREKLQLLAEEVKKDSLYFVQYNNGLELYNNINIFSCVIIKNERDTVFQYGDFKELPQNIQSISQYFEEVSDFEFANTRNGDSIRTFLSQYEKNSFIKMVVPPPPPLNLRGKFTPPVVTPD